MTHVLVPSSDSSPAAWITLSRLGAGVVQSVVPGGFESYARILHPAMLLTTEQQWVEVQWSQLAQDALTPTTSWEDLAQPHAQPHFDEPEVGSLPISMVEPLAQVLSQHTATPDRVWFAVWVGWGGVTPSPDSDVLLRRDEPRRWSKKRHRAKPRRWSKKRHRRWSKKRHRAKAEAGETGWAEFTAGDRHYFLFSGHIDAVRTSVDARPRFPIREPVVAG